MDTGELREAIKKIIINIQQKSADKLIPIEASGRHVHLSQGDVDKLFGKDYKLTPKRELSQPGQFLAEEKIKIIGSKGIIEKAAVLGPARSKSQIELSKTDAVKLGIDAPLRFSGNTKNSASAFIASENNVIKLDEGVIIAKRHIHMTPEDSVKFDVKDKDMVSVLCDTEGRKTIFQDVLIRVSPKYALEFHADTDEANASFLKTGDEIQIIKEL